MRKLSARDSCKPKAFLYFFIGHPTSDPRDAYGLLSYSERFRRGYPFRPISANEKNESSLYFGLDLFCIAGPFLQSCCRRRK